MRLFALSACVSRLRNKNPATTAKGDLNCLACSIHDVTNVARQWLQRVQTSVLAYRTNRLTHRSTDPSLHQIPGARLEPSLGGLLCDERSPSMNERGRQQASRDPLRPVASARSPSGRCQLASWPSLPRVGAARQPRITLHVSAWEFSSDGFINIEQMVA